MKCYELPSCFLPLRIKSQDVVVNKVLENRWNVCLRKQTIRIPSPDDDVQDSCLMCRMKNWQKHEQKDSNFIIEHDQIDMGY